MGQPQACPQSSRLPGVSVIWLFFKKIIYDLWLHWPQVAARGLSLVAVNWDCSSLWCTGLLIEVASLWAQWLWRTGLVPEACGIFPDQGLNPQSLCVGGRILNQWTTRKALILFLRLSSQALSLVRVVYCSVSVWSEVVFAPLCHKEPCVNSQCVSWGSFQVCSMPWPECPWSVSAQGMCAQPVLS